MVPGVVAGGAGEAGLEISKAARATALVRDPLPRTYVPTPAARAISRAVENNTAGDPRRRAPGASIPPSPTGLEDTPSSDVGGGLGRRGAA
jgi:hypothetical protein